MSYKDLREVRDCYSALRELVIHAGGGWNDVASREKVERLCAAGIDAIDDEDSRDVLHRIRVQASDLFSRFAHLKWARRSMSGADYLRLQILISLETLNTRIAFVEALRDRAAAQQPSDSLSAK